MSDYGDNNEMTAQIFGTALVTNGPLQFNFPITPQVSVSTNVFGEARNNATVTILSGTIPAWSGSMTQLSPVVETPSELILGDAVIKAGAKFTLTIPTSLQNGNVLMNAEIKSAGNPFQPFIAIVASWPLTSSPA